MIHYTAQLKPTALGGACALGDRPARAHATPTALGRYTLFYLFHPIPGTGSAPLGAQKQTLKEQKLEQIQKSIMYYE